MSFGFDDEKEPVVLCDVCGRECRDEQDALHERHYECEEQGEEPEGFEEGYREYLDGPLEEQWENAQFAGDDELANMGADEVL